ncbi:MULTISPECIES: GntR family transcriptional regulator [unclassified Streptomyces]|uniref:GntR family transcriptional regulator n=1 Tax=unclassified Streptomyces TaxID=2593676 RepID=UPI002237F0EF|nr:GntR family transcriptional regulator [Streptomyces sp. SHP 1-2]
MPGAMSAQDSTYERLRTRILHLPHDEGVFFNEVALATELGISRTPVREALLRLEAQGWLKILPRKGAFIPPISDSEIASVMQARFLIEEWSVKQVIEARLELCDSLDEMLDEQEKHLEDATSFIELDRQFHRTIVAAAGNPVLAEFYETLRDRQLRMSIRAMGSRGDRGRQVMDEHRAIVTGLRELDADRAAQEVHSHLDATLAALRSHGPALSSTLKGLG